MGRKKTVKTIDEVLENSKIDQQPQEENLVKKTCRELGITQKELAEKIGVAPYTISRWANGEIDKTIEVFLDALIYKHRFLILEKLFVNTQIIHKVS